MQKNKKMRLLYCAMLFWTGLFALALFVLAVVAGRKKDWMVFGIALFLCNFTCMTYFASDLYLKIRSKLEEFDRQISNTRGDNP